MKLNEQLDNYDKALDLLRSFDGRFGDRLPEGMGCYSISFYGPPGYNVYLLGRDDSDREKALAVAGEVFGTDGWESEWSQGYNAFTWSKEVFGIGIRIEGAKAVPPPVKSRVHPNEFPVLLKDRTIDT